VSPQPDVDVVELAGDDVASSDPDPAVVDRTVTVLAGGGTVVLPTDTVYGVAALASVDGATDQLFALKDRPGHQPLAVLVADLGQALQLVEEPVPEVRGWMETLWPGPLTLVLRRRVGARDLALGGNEATIGVRCPDHRFVRAVAARLGPLATTSANRHGEATPSSARDAAAALAGRVDLVVDGGPAGATASTVVDGSITPWLVLRAGALPADRLT